MKSFQSIPLFECSQLKLEGDKLAQEFKAIVELSLAHFRPQDLDLLIFSVRVERNDPDRHICEL